MSSTSWPIKVKELRSFANNYGELTLTENPYPLARFEVWIQRIDWKGWCRLVATDDLEGAESVFQKALFQLL